MKVNMAAKLLRAAAAEARQEAGVALQADDGAGAGFLLQEPVGVVSVVLEYARAGVLSTLARLTSFAIAAGNAVVAAAPYEAPLACVEFALVLNEAGLPPGVFNVLSGKQTFDFATILGCVRRRCSRAGGPKAIGYPPPLALAKSRAC